MMQAHDFPSISRDQFLDAMQQLPGAVTIVTTGTGRDRVGFTATAVCSLSAEPPQLLVCVNRSTRSFAAMERADSFAVNVLADSDSETATRFASLPQEERFATGDWQTLTSGAPVLGTAAVTFDCSLAQIWQQDSHAIICGRIVASRTSAADPLLYARRTYLSLGQSASGGVEK